MGELKLSEANLSALYAEARIWLAECGFVHAATLSDFDAVRNVSVVYDGGWKAFEWDNRVLLSE